MRSDDREIVCDGRWTGPRHLVSNLFASPHLRFRLLLAQDQGTVP